MSSATCISCAASLLLLEAMLSDVCGAKPQVALSPRNQSTWVLMHSHDSHFPMLELLCCGLVVLLLQLLQQSCWQAPCGVVERVGQAARAQVKTTTQRYFSTCTQMHRKTHTTGDDNFVFFSSLPVWPLIVHRFRPRRSGVTLWAGSLCGRLFMRTLQERASSSAPSELLMEEVLSACGWAVQPQTLGFLNLLCVAG